jgi:hypothetical protein
MRDISQFHTLIYFPVTCRQGAPTRHVFAKKIPEANLTTDWPPTVRPNNQEILSICHRAARTAFHAFDRKFVIRRKGMGIQHGATEDKDGYLPGAECDLQGARMHGYVLGFLVARGAMMIIGLGGSHIGFLLHQATVIFFIFDLERHYGFSLSLRIAHHTHTTVATTISNMMIPPNHGLCILSLLLS